MRAQLLYLARRRAVAALGLGLASALAPAAAHDLTPTTVLEIPMQLDVQTGSVLFATMIGPPAGENVWHTTLHLTWINTGPTPASEFSIELSLPIVGGPSPHWKVTGAQLGWGAGPGTYTAVVETDLLDGEAASAFGLPIATFSVVVDAASGGGLWGQVKDSKIVLDLGPRMMGDVGAVSLSAGGAQHLALNAGPTVGPGKPYLVVGSTSGSAPGFGFAGVHVPLNFDAYTVFGIASPNTPPLAGSFGLLDSAGRGSATFAIPAGTDPSLAGTAIHHAFALIDGASATLLSASNAVQLLLTP